MKCGHAFCKDCWHEYFKEKLKLGPTCVYAKCMQTKCPLSVNHTMWRWVLENDETNLALYNKFHCKNFTDDNKNVQWCPAPGCDYAVWVTNLAHKDITCKCGKSFCFKCSLATHRPCSCEVAQKWNAKNSSESENVTWMIANTKNCPGCKRPIEKNQGCNHMTCSWCGHDFCWMCMGLWSEHGSSTGGYYKCNVYEKNKEEGKVSKEE